MGYTYEAGNTFCTWWTYQVENNAHYIKNMLKIFPITPFDEGQGALGTESLFKNKLANGKIRLALKNRRQQIFTASIFLNTLI